MKRTEAGASLLELLCTCAIVAIVTSLSLPTLGDIIDQQRVKSTMHELRKLIKTARQTAVFHQTVVTLCPSNDGKNCSSDWTSPLILFEDPNHNETLDDGERLHQQSSLDIVAANLSWRSLNSFVQFSSQGFTRGTSGSMRYCPKDKTKAHLYRKLIVALSGRVRSLSAKPGIKQKALLKDFDC